MLKTNLHEILGKRRMKQSELARRAGVSPNTIYLLYHDKWNMIGRSTIEKICETLKISPGVLFEYDASLRSGPNQAV
jgi:DNA-binding Xre family transcriptional regulator